MKTIRHTSTLFYYDGPQVFEARDAIGGHYIAVAVESQDAQDRYLVTGVAPERLRQFRSGTLDLRSLLVQPVEDEWYLATATAGLDVPLELVRQKTSLPDSQFLPDKDFVLYDHPANEFVLEEARERRNLVLEIATHPPEATTDHRIRVNTLVGLLHFVQAMVRHAYRTTTKRLTLPSSQRDSHMMDIVVPAAAGSFRVVLEASNPSDLFGYNELTPALQKMDEFFEKSGSPHDIRTILREHQGHLASTYVKLVRFLEDRKTGLYYSWAEPNSLRPNTYSVSEREVGPLVKGFSTVTNLGVEHVTVEGRLERFNRRTGAWGLFMDGERVSGVTRKGGLGLDGLEVDGRYRFHCEEELEEIDITGRETRKLYLTAHERA